MKKERHRMKACAPKILKPCAAGAIVFFCCILCHAVETDGQETPAVIKTHKLDLGTRAECGGPVVQTADGRLLWVVLYPAEGAARVGLLESRDDGDSWSAPRLLLSSDAKTPYQSNGMTRLASGRLLHLLSYVVSYDAAHFDRCSNEGRVQWSDDNGKTWTEPTPLPTGERYLSNVLSITQLKSGRVVFPFGFLTPDRGRFVVSACWSDDEGATWQRSASRLDAGGTGFETGAIEPSVAELPDGRLWMLIRTQTGVQCQSFSNDGGETWTPAAPSRIPSSNSPAVLQRLRDGRVLVVWNNCTRGSYDRYSLVAATTMDGRNFQGFREIANSDAPHATPRMYWGAMYPYLAEGRDGHLLVSYNWGNWAQAGEPVVENRAVFARLDPGWVDEAACREDFTQGRAAWCAFGATGDRLLPADDGAPGCWLDLTQQANKRCGLTRNVPLLKRGTLTVTAQIERGDAFLMLHHTFLDPGASDEALLRVRFAADGEVYWGAGAPTPVTVSKSPSYSYTAYPIGAEAKYPARVAVGRPFRLKIMIDAEARKAILSLDDGPQLPVAVPETLGICYLGAGASDGGHWRIRRIETAPSGTGF